MELNIQWGRSKIELMQGVYSPQRSSWRQIASIWRTSYHPQSWPCLCQVLLLRRSLHNWEEKCTLVSKGLISSVHLADDVLLWRKPFYISTLSRTHKVGTHVIYNFLKATWCTQWIQQWVTHNQCIIILSDVSHKHPAVGNWGSGYRSEPKSGLC